MGKKGPARTESYAARIQKMKGIYGDEYRKAVVHHCVETMYKCSAVALNEEFGFGKERILRFAEMVNELMLEYGQMQDSADTEYATGALERRYDQIMGARE